MVNVHEHTIVSFKMSCYNCGSLCLQLQKDASRNLDSMLVRNAFKIQIHLIKKIFLLLLFGKEWEDLMDTDRNLR